jgi:hypothetical protein
MAGFACRIHDRSVVFATLDGARGRTVWRNDYDQQPPLNPCPSTSSAPDGTTLTAKHQRAYACAIRQSNQEHAAPNPLSQVGYTQ